MSAQICIYAKHRKLLHYSVIRPEKRPLPCVKNFETLINRFTICQPFGRHIDDIMEHSHSLRALQVGFFLLIVCASFVDFTGPNSVWTALTNNMSEDRQDAAPNFRHDASMHNAHLRLDLALENGVESARAADLAIENLDCWETELRSNGETAKADACKQGFESALAAISSPSYTMQANLRFIEP